VAIEAKWAKHIWGMAMTNLFYLWRKSHCRMLMELKWSRLLHTMSGLSKSLSDILVASSSAYACDVDRKQQEDAGVALKTDT
jgi:hypothetical protein